MTQQTLTSAWDGATRLAPEDAAAFTWAPNDRGMTIGHAVFDTLLCVGGYAVQAERHIARLLNHARRTGIAGDLPEAGGLIDAAAAFAQAGEQAAPGQAYAIRTTISAGPGPRGLGPLKNPVPQTLMICAPCPAMPSDITMIVAQGTRRNEFSPASRLKTSSYGDNRIAQDEARAAGAQDAIMLNTRGFASCASTSTLIVDDGARLVTPSCEHGAMEGIGRGILLEKQLMIESGAGIDATALHAAKNLFLLNAVSVRRVARLDDTDYAARDHNRSAPHVAAFLQCLKDTLHVEIR